VKAGFGLVYAAARLGSGSLVAPAIAHALVWIVAGTI
jgi:membrane protease YdiL (CAAX protease family)